MKAILIIILSLVIIITSTSKSVNAGNPKDINKILNKEISYPDFAKQQKIEGMVLVNFSINTDGSVKVNLTNESDATLRDYVVSKLKKIKILHSKNEAEKTYNVKFEFKIEK